MLVCDAHILRTIHQIDYTLGKFVNEVQRKCSVKFGVIWTSDIFHIHIYLINGAVVGVWLQCFVSITLLTEAGLTCDHSLETQT